MKRIFLFFTILLIASLTMSAGVRAEEGTPDQTDGIYMWKVSQPNDNSGKNVIYLTGSLAISDNSLLPIDEKLQKAYSDCSNLIIETDVSKTTQEQTVASLMKYGLLTGTTLDKVLSKDLYTKADTYIKKYTGNKKSLSDYKNFKPWVIDSLIANLKASTLKGYSQDIICTYFTQQARKDKKNVFELETLDYQYSMLASASYPLQSALLKNTITSLDNYGGTTADAVSAWKKGDTDSISGIYTPDLQSQSDLEDTYNRLILQRNSKTADYLGNCLKKGGKYFTVTGASRLTGSNSIIKLLESKGYNVEQVH
jgi:uncharacterized protein YbaP (TraB family)